MAEAVPVPEAASPTAAADPALPMGDIFAQYKAGTPQDMFAPAYIKGFAPSEKAVNAWTAWNRNVSPAMIDQLRMPNEWRGQSPMSGGNGVYGGPIPLNQTYGDPKGQIDIEALRTMAQGGHYDVEGRRNAIAARLAANQAGQAAAPVYPASVEPLSLRSPEDDRLTELEKRLNAMNTNHD